MSDSEMTIPMDRHRGNGDQHIQNGPTITSNTGLDHGICYPVKIELIDPCELTDTPIRNNQDDGCIDVVPFNIYPNITKKDIKVEPSMLESCVSTYEMTESTNFEPDVVSGQYLDLQTSDHQYNNENITCYREESTCTSREVLNQISHIKQEHLEFIEPVSMAFTNYNGLYSDQVENGNSYNVSPDETSHDKQNMQNLILQINNESTSETNPQNRCEISDDANDNTEGSGQYFVQLEKPNDHTYKCDMCNYTTERPTSLTLHNLLHESSSLKGHESKNTKAEIYTCQRCGYNTANFYYLKQHSKLHTAKHVCDECSCRFQTQRGLSKHKLKYSGEKHYCCGLCSKTAKTVMDINSHELTHTGEKLFGFKCVECNFSCQTRWGLQLHQITHSKERPYACDLCSYRAKTPLCIQRHKWTHVKEKPYKCDMCSYSAATKSYLRLHKEKRCKRGKPKETPYRCDLCNFSTSNSFYHKRHKMAHNADDRRYKCGICSYSTSGSLRMHMIKHHADHRPYKCGTCNYSTSSSYDLKRHVIGKHTADKPYKCNTCNYSTSWRDCLRKHIMKEHTDGRPHECGTCNYATVYPQNLKLHIKRTKHKGKASLAVDSISTKYREIFTAVHKRKDIPKTTFEGEEYSNKSGTLEDKVHEQSCLLETQSTCDICDVSVSVSFIDERREIKSDEKVIKQDVGDDSTSLENNPKEQRLVLLEKPVASASTTREHGEINSIKKFIKQEISEDCTALVYSPMEQRTADPAMSTSITRKHRESHPLEKLIKQEVSDDDPPMVYSHMEQRTEKPATSPSITREHREIHPLEKSIKQEVTNDNTPLVSNTTEQKTQKPATSASINRENREINSAEKLIKQEVSDDKNPNMQRSVVSEKPYKCDICDFTAVRASIVKVHRKIHLGESPLKRGVGDNSALQLGNSIKQKKTTMGEMPYKCDLCKFGTLHSSILDIHKAIHLEDKNWVHNTVVVVFVFEWILFDHHWYWSTKRYFF